MPEINSLKTNNKLVRYLTDDEETRLLYALPSRLRPLVLVAIHTGMRKGELLNLRWDDVDFVSDTVTVREAKSGEGRRLPMSATARRALQTAGRLRGQHLKMRPVNQGSSHVFSAPQGGFLMNLNRDWYRVQMLMGHKTPAMTYVTRTSVLNIYERPLPCWMTRRERNHGPMLAGKPDIASLAIYTFIHTMGCYSGYF